MKNLLKTKEVEVFPLQVGIEKSEHPMEMFFMIKHVFSYLKNWAML